MVHSEEELKMLVTASQEAGVLEEQEEQMLHRVFGFSDLTAGQIHALTSTELSGLSAGGVPSDHGSFQFLAGPGPAMFGFVFRSLSG